MEEAGTENEMTKASARRSLFMITLQIHLMGVSDDGGGFPSPMDAR
jgi:hypothetical protein